MHNERGSGDFVSRTGVYDSSYFFYSFFRSVLRGVWCENTLPIFCSMFFLVSLIVPPVCDYFTFLESF